MEKAQGGGDFWLWENQFGICVGGAHPLVDSLISRSDSLYTVMKVVTEDISCREEFRIPTCSAYLAKSAVVDSSDFFRSEQLGTVVEPKCGSCRCGKCPIPGSRYSFREETELKMIEENLQYDEIRGCWIAAYPFLFPRETLKGDKIVALRSMEATEKMLLKRGDWSGVYQSQIQDMLDRDVVRIVPEEELKLYNGHVNYLPHLAVVNPRSQSTPVRICFDASRMQGGGPSLNQILAKGPDRYLNNLAGVIINFRDGRVAAKGDVRKMYNAVRLIPEDAFVQCFMWRNGDTSRVPDTYQVLVNNIGVKPAGAIASLALQKSANLHEDQFPITAQQLVKKSYVDDIGITAKNRETLKKRTVEANQILRHANMEVKQWVLSGEGLQLDSIDMISNNVDGEQMLGVLWVPRKDVFKFSVRVNLSLLKNKS